MATILENAAYMALPMNIKRGNPIPLDTTAVWYNKTELETYAASGATAYVGQILTFYGNVTDPETSQTHKVCEAYMISNEAGTLVKLAQTTASGDLAADVAALQTAVAAAQAAAEAAQTTANKGVSDAATAQAKANEAATLAGKNETAIANINNYVGTDDATGLGKLIKDNATAISTIQGTDTSKSIRTIASEEVAKVVDGAGESFDTLKEIAEWITTHGSQAADLSTAVAKLQGIVAGIGGEGEKATVVAYVTEAINALKIGDYAKAADLTALAAKVTTLEGLPAAGITAEQIEAWTGKQDAGNYVDQSDYNTKITALEEADSTNSQAIAAVKKTADAAVPKNAAATAGTGIKVTVDSNGLVTGLSSLTKEDIPSIEQDQVTGLAASLAAKQDTLTFNTAYDKATNKAATMADVGDAKNDLVGTAEDKSTLDTIKGAKKYADEKATDAETAAKAYADGLVTGDSGITKRVETLESKVDVDKVSTAISTAKTAAATDATNKVNAAKTAILGKNADDSDYVGTVKGAYEAAADASAKVDTAKTAILGTDADGSNYNGTVKGAYEAAADAKTAADSKATMAEVEAKNYATKTEAEGYANTAKEAAIAKSNEVAAKLGTIAEGQTAAGLISANADAISTLNGNDTTNGSVKKTVKDAINEFATNISDDGTVNTFKELVDYVAAHGNEYTDAIADIAANKGAIQTLNGDSSTVGSVAKSVKDAVDPVATRVSTLEGKVTDAKIAEWDSAKDSIDSAVEAGVASLDYTDTAVADQFVTAVNQTDGVIAVTRGALPKATAAKLGLVKPDDSTLQVDASGVMSIKAVNVQTLYVAEGDTLVLNGGNA